MDSITILSLNCQGLGNIRKRRDVFHYLKKKSCSIYCLQDTHFSTKLETYVKAEWGYNCFFASYSSNSRGVAVMFKEYQNHNIIIAGDWNLMLDPQLDSYNYKHINNPKARVR